MVQFTCPACGHVLTVQAVSKQIPARPKFKRQDWQEFAFTVGEGKDAPALVGATFKRQQPARMASVESDVQVPFLQAVICGAVVGLLALVVGTPLAVREKWAWWVPPGAVCLAFTVVMALAWGIFLGAHRKLLWLVEEVTSQDLDRDGQTGEPAEVHVWVTEPDKRQAKKVVLPLSEQEMQQVAKAVLRAGLPLSRRGLKGVLSDGKFRRLYDTLLEKGWVIHKEGGPNAGVELTYAGRAVLQHFLGN